MHYGTSSWWFIIFTYNVRLYLYTIFKLYTSYIHFKSVLYSAVITLFDSRWTLLLRVFAADCLRESSQQLKRFYNRTTFTFTVDYCEKIQYQMDASSIFSIGHVFIFSYFWYYRFISISRLYSYKFVTLISVITAICHHID